MKNPTQLCKIAKVIRSKNAGPFEVTFDILFNSERDYQIVRDSEVITPQSFANLYQLPLNHLITFGFFDAIQAWKATIRRPRQQGSIGETDMHAAQMHVPLQSLVIDYPLPE